MKLPRSILRVVLLLLKMIHLGRQLRAWLRSLRDLGVLLPAVLTVVHIVRVVPLVSFLVNSHLVFQLLPGLRRVLLLCLILNLLLVSDYLFKHLYVVLWGVTIVRHQVRLLFHEVQLIVLSDDYWLSELLRLLRAIAFCRRLLLGFTCLLTHLWLDLAGELQILSLNTLSVHAGVLVLFCE